MKSYEDYKDDLERLKDRWTREAYREAYDQYRKHTGKEITAVRNNEVDAYRHAYVSAKITQFLADSQRLSEIITDRAGVNGIAIDQIDPNHRPNVNAETGMVDFRHTNESFTLEKLCIIKQYAGMDTLLLGDGQDTLIQDDHYRATAYINTVVFGENIDLSDLNLVKVSNHLIMHVGSDGDQLKLNNWFRSTDYQADRFELADGTAYTAKNQLEYFADLSAMYFVGGNYFPFNRAGIA